MLLIEKGADLIGNDVSIIPDAIAGPAGVIVRYAIVFNAPRWKGQEFAQRQHFGG